METRVVEQKGLLGLSHNNITTLLCSLPPSFSLPYEDSREYFFQVTLKEKDRNTPTCNHKDQLKGVSKIV